MSSPMELVHLAADSPLVSWRDRDLKFFQAPYMQQCPELEKGEGASFGTFQLREGAKTGWLVIPNPAALGAAAQKAFVANLSAKPGLDEAALERLELERLCWEYAESRRLREWTAQSWRLGGQNLQTVSPQVQPQVRLAMQPSEVYQGEWCAPARPRSCSRSLSMAIHAEGASPPVCRYQLAGEDDDEVVRIISPPNADGEWQARAPPHTLH